MLKITQKKTMTILAMALWLCAAAISPRITEAQNTQEDALQQLASLLTQSVLLTRGDAGLENSEIEKHLIKLEKEMVRMIETIARHAPEEYSDDIHLHRDLGAMLTNLKTARHLLEHGDKHSAHHACKEMRLQLAAVRSRNGIVSSGDYMWRYNCAFHPMMHEIMHHSGDQGISNEQVKTCERAMKNAQLALAALKAVVHKKGGSHSPKTISLIEECETTLANLDDTLKRQETEKISKEVKAIRSAYINLATHISDM